MDLPPNFVGMSERQQLRYLSEQAEAANKPPEPVAAGPPFQLVSTGVTNFCPAEPVKKKKPKKRPRAFVVESILDKRVCLDTVLRAPHYNQCALLFLTNNCFAARFRPPVVRGVTHAGLILLYD